MKMLYQNSDLCIFKVREHCFKAPCMGYGGEVPARGSANTVRRLPTAQKSDKLIGKFEIGKIVFTDGLSQCQCQTYQNYEQTPQRLQNS